MLRVLSSIALTCFLAKGFDLGDFILTKSKLVESVREIAFNFQ